jgi:hypothetical protein
MKTRLRSPIIKPKRAGVSPSASTVRPKVNLLRTQTQARVQARLIGDDTIHAQKVDKVTEILEHFK